MSAVLAAPRGRPTSLGDRRARLKIAVVLAAALPGTLCVERPFRTAPEPFRVRSVPTTNDPDASAST